MIRVAKRTLIVLAGLAGIAGLAFEQATYSLESEIQKQDLKIAATSQQLLGSIQIHSRAESLLMRALTLSLDYAELATTVEKVAVDNEKLLFYPGCSELGSRLELGVDMERIEVILDAIAWLFASLLKEKNYVNHYGVKGTGMYPDEVDYEHALKRHSAFEETLFEFKQAKSTDAKASVIPEVLTWGFMQLGSIDQRNLVMTGYKMGQIENKEQLVIKRQFFALSSILSSIFALLFTFLFFRVSIGEAAQNTEDNIHEAVK